MHSSEGGKHGNGEWWSWSHSIAIRCDHIYWFYFMHIFFVLWFIIRFYEEKNP